MRSGLPRVGDLLVAVVLILSTLPLIGFVSLVIKLDSTGPVFVRHPQLGQDGRRFFAMRFRTTEHAHGLRDRETRVGRFLTYTRIDELPGIFNLLLGDFSFSATEPRRAIGKMWPSGRRGRQPPL
jgi:lipopolysaccharide/colanic/teichoic acid biosynthesis glycosyltransferase